MAQFTGEFPRPISRPAWLTARARNAVNRPIFIGAVGLGAFVVALVALFLAPQQARPGARRIAPPVDARPDTAPLVAALAQARGRVVSADSSLTSARSRAHVMPPNVAALSAAATATRDTLSTAVNNLDALLTRAESAPVPASFHALGESPELSTNPRVKSLLDSLSDIERDQDAIGAAGSTDPVFLALSTSAAQIGRMVQAIAQDRRDALRQQIAKLSGPTPAEVIAQSPASDTTAWIATRDSAQSLVAQATTALSDAREKAQRHDLEVSRATSQAQVEVPPIALLGAALVFGITLGFGSAFVGEMRDPRISSDHELERVTGARVLATVRPRPRQPDRRRRHADHDVPPYFDPAADGYQLTYLHVARAGASRLMLTVASGEAGIAAVVAANVAAIAADEARSTILVDTDSRTSPVSAVLRIPAEPGLVDVIDGRGDWPEVTIPAQVGRDRAIDVLPSGVSDRPREASAIVAFFRREAARIGRHYEAIIVATSFEHARVGVPGALPIPDTILCARVGYTRIADLQATITAVRAVGGNPLGVVLWQAPPPSLPPFERAAQAQRPARTDGVPELTPSR